MISSICSALSMIVVGGIATPYCGDCAYCADHLGFGRSDKPTDPELYRIPRHAQRLDALLESLDLREAGIVPQDWGGPIGPSWAVAHPERVSETRLSPIAGPGAAPRPIAWGQPNARLGVSRRRRRRFRRPAP